MAATSLIASNALNFMSAVKSGVDPRTGLYGVSINLPKIQSNDLRGPGLELGLAYSVLNKTDNGYGMGWNLQLTQYHLANKMITLSTGEALKVTSEAAQGNRTRLFMAEQKIDGFHFYREKLPNGNDQYRLIHKSGQVELLRAVGTPATFALPAQILAPTGHRLRLEYEAFTATSFILKQVIDDANVVVLSVARIPSPKAVKITLHPTGGPGGEPVAQYAMALNSTGQVESIQLPGEGIGSWTFGYGDKIRDYLCIRTVDTPLGGHEDVTYGDAGHEFPQNAHPPLPRVTRHVIDPGFDQPPIEMRYTYENKDGKLYNFLGYGVGLGWQNNGRDNLYEYSLDYEYACVESLYVAGRAVRTVDRRFNRIHLLATEITTQADNIQTVFTEYNLQPSTHFVDQPKDCQLPRTVTTTWKNNSTGRVRSEVVSNTYDPSGNLLSKTSASGVVETTEWYPATASPGCPADPEGFICQVKEKRTTPATPGTAPVLATQYTYRALDAVAVLPDGGMTKWTTLASETLVQNPGASTVELQRIEFTHTDSLSDPFQHGRPATQATTLSEPGTGRALTTAVRYRYEKVRNVRPGLHVQRTTETLSTNFDATGKSIVREHELVTASEVTSTVDNVEVHFEHDALGRLTNETVSPSSTQFTAKRQYRYMLLALPGGPAQVLHAVLLQTDASGTTLRTWLDGCGRVVMQDQDHVTTTAPAVFRETYKAQYDAWNNLEQSTETDWWLDNGQPVSMALSTGYEYDDWGQLACTISPDGAKAFTRTDPIGIYAPPGPVQRSWLAGADGSVTGITETRLNLFAKPAEIRQFAAGVDPDALPAVPPYATQTFTYDGLGRCTAQTDPVTNTTGFEYDAWSRLVTTTLPDNTRVARTYCAHSTAQLPEQISVTGDDGEIQVAGTQTFDGLERLTTATSGGRTQRYAYEPGLAQVSNRTTAAGHRIDYTYNLQLTDQPVSATAVDETTEFKYHDTNADLLEASNQLGTRRYEFDLTHQLSVEHWQPGGGPSWRTRHWASLRGRPLQRTDQEQDNSPGLATEYAYDPRTGRLQQLTQGHVQAAFAYDSLGRLILTTTKDLNNNSQLVTALEYDDYGREIKRTLSASGMPARTLVQAWQEDGQLQKRHLQEGELSLLEETFEYDPRGRLATHRCAGSELPADSLGRPYTQQDLTFDALDNIKTSTLFFTDDTTELSIFRYQAADPCQLTGVVYIPAQPTRPPLSFTYDANGNQQNDEHGRTLVYDSQSRLTEVQGGAAYQYDGHDHLVSVARGAQAPVLRFYQDERLRSVVEDGQPIHLLYHGDQPLAQQAGGAADTLLLHTNANNSVLAEGGGAVLRDSTYSAYGARNGEQTCASLLAFNGELLEHDYGWYLLGSGYRAYNPSLMRFHSPDSLSPFGSGGLNPYTYCLGNPIALRDPTGHASTGWGRLPRFDDNWDAVDKPKAGFEAWLNVAIGAAFVAVGVVTFVTSFGTASPLSLAFIGFGTAIQAGSVGASAHAVATGSPDSERTASILGYVALAAAVPSIAGGMLKMGTKKAVEEVAKRSVSARSSFSSMASVADDAVPMKPFLVGGSSPKGSATIMGQRQWYNAGDFRVGGFRPFAAAIAKPVKPKPAWQPSSQAVDLNDPRLLRAGSEATASASNTSGRLADSLRELGLGKKSTVFETGSTVAEIGMELGYRLKIRRANTPQS